MDLAFWLAPEWWGPPKLGDNRRVALIDVDTVLTTYTKQMLFCRFFTISLGKNVLGGKAVVCVQQGFLAVIKLTKERPGSRRQAFWGCEEYTTTMVWDMRTFSVTWPCNYLKSHHHFSMHTDDRLVNPLVRC